VPEESFGYVSFQPQICIEIQRLLISVLEVLNLPVREEDLVMLGFGAVG
jgi:hypothetical protein